jgi:NAD(P)-dependent dehydrogenase (short-subunit alcohol dehydrogenase family)
MEKIILITGATSGIGKATALELMRSDAQVVIGARTAASGEAVRNEFRTLSGRGNVDVLSGDLSALAAVRGMADEFQKRYPRLDVLINNAGIYKNTRQLSADGFELMFAVNHLAPFLLTNLLLDPLKTSGHARVINIAAPSTTKLDFDNLQGEKNFNALNAFGVSKMANLLFTFELARRLEGTGVLVNAIHPGLVRSHLMGDANFFLRTMLNLFSGKPEKAALGILGVALSDQFDNQTGKFYSQGKEIKADPYAQDREVQKKLWDVSMKLTGLG